MTGKTVYTIPAGVPFAKALAAELLRRADGKPEELCRMRILLPTRRACQILREAFLEISGGKPLLLPVIQPLGDIDEQELFFGFFGSEKMPDIPPGMSALRRQILLARAVQKIPGFTSRGFDQALALAGALGQFLDQVYTEGLEFAALADLVPDSFSSHWQITLNFLKVLSEVWPGILEAEGCIDPALRRDRLLRAAARHWAQTPPDTPIIAAGSTGSIPATAELLSVIADLPQGCVVLPGLDQESGDDYWNAVSEGHPQYGMKHLLQHMGTNRKDVKSWPAQETLTGKHRRFLASEIMRPATTTQNWIALATQDKTKMIERGLKDLSIAACANERSEAQTVAVLLRETLETKGKTAIVITPDRVLARRIVSVCKRWGIIVDDSAGCPLPQTPVGVFLRLCLETVSNQFSPLSVLALLKHPLCRMGMDEGRFHTAVEALDRLVLRGLPPEPGLEGLNQRILLTPGVPPETLELFNTLQIAFQRFNKEINNMECAFEGFIRHHLALAEELASGKVEEADSTLWLKEAGESASTFFAELLQQADSLPALDLPSYAASIAALMQDIVVRPTGGMHPRLRILGQLEARHADADTIILAGMNEGIWPSSARHDPWMSRPMRHQFGLPPSERSMGLEAHDFVQAFCAEKVFITRSMRSAGSPTVPSRWLQRLEAIIQAAGVEKALAPPQAVQWIEDLDRSDSVKSCARPAPCPPPHSRPRRLSVTGVEQWIKDPYGLYARHILKLKKLQPLVKLPDAAERGKLLHHILQQFITAHPAGLPENAAKILENVAQKEIQNYGGDAAFWHFWWPRFQRLSEWFAAHEKAWRNTAKPALTETPGGITLQVDGKDFTLEARPDRLDLTPQGEAIVIDYKTGGQFTKKAITNGKRPQLGLEALILERGGFKALGSRHIRSLAYWILKGGHPAGEVISVEKDITAILQNAATGIESYVRVFDNPETPYLCIPRPDLVPEYNDYKHLARITEWSASADNADDTVSLGEAA